MTSAAQILEADGSRAAGRRDRRAAPPAGERGGAANRRYDEGGARARLGAGGAVRDGPRADDRVGHEARWTSTGPPSTPSEPVWPGRGGRPSRSSAPPSSTRSSRSRRWRPSSCASCRTGTAGSTSRSGTASGACSRTRRGELRLWSRNARPLLRYFPELRSLGDAAAAALGARRRDRDRSATARSTSTRCRRACIRPRAASTGSSARDPRDASSPSTCSSGRASEPGTSPLRERRAALEKRCSGFALSPATPDRDEALGWLDRFEAIGLDGVIAKRLDRAVPARRARRRREGEAREDRRLRRRRLRWKAKPDADRDAPARPLRATTGSSTTSARPPSRRASHDEIAERVLPLLDDAPERRFSEPNRWGGGELEESARAARARRRGALRQGAGSTASATARSSLRFRPDKDPAQCTWRELRPPRAPGRPDGREPAR